MRMQDILGTGQGTQDIPYDQTQPQDPAQDVMAGAQMAGQQQPPDPYGGANVAPTMDMGAPQGDPAMQAEQMGAQPQDLAAGTDMLSNQELAAVDDPNAPNMEQIMNDPTNSPEVQAELQQQILMAARRQLAGI